jgi:uncharacterized protein (TIGR03086 family)
VNRRGVRVGLPRPRAGLCRGCGVGGHDGRAPGGGVGCQTRCVTLDLLLALDASVEEFRRPLTVVSAGDWDAATPCTDWNVRYLVAHVVGGNRFASLILDGATSDDAMAVVLDTPQLGPRPVDDFDESAAAQRARFHRAGAREGVVSHPVGDVPGERFLRMRVFDIALHAWDLGRALGRDATLPGSLAETVLEIAQQEVPGTGLGSEPCGAVGPDASVMDRLLDLTGRCSPVDA